MNNTSTRLVHAARDALTLHRADKWLPFNVEKAAAVATVALLRELVFMMNQAEVAEFVDGGDWPQATDLHLLADDVERSL